MDMQCKACRNVWEFRGARRRTAFAVSFLGAMLSIGLVVFFNTDPHSWEVLILCLLIGLGLAAGIYFSKSGAEGAGPTCPRCKSVNVQAVPFSS